jgi:hypothetical protein
MLALIDCIKAVAISMTISMIIPISIGGAGGGGHATLIQFGDMAGISLIFLVRRELHRVNLAFGFSRCPNRVRHPNQSEP